MRRRWWDIQLSCVQHIQPVTNIGYRSVENGAFLVSYGRQYWTTCNLQYHPETCGYLFCITAGKELCSFMLSFSTLRFRWFTQRCFWHSEVIHKEARWTHSEDIKVFYFLNRYWKHTATIYYSWVRVTLASIKTQKPTKYNTCIIQDDFLNDLSITLTVSGDILRENPQKLLQIMQTPQLKR